MTIRGSESSSSDTPSPLPSAAVPLEYQDPDPPADLHAAGERMTFSDCDEMLFCIAAILEERQLNGWTHAQMMRWKFRQLASRSSVETPPPEMPSQFAADRTYLRGVIRKGRRREASFVDVNTDTLERILNRAVKYAALLPEGEATSHGPTDHPLSAGAVVPGSGDSNP